MINASWCLSVACGVLCSFEASGAHLNPTVTLCEVIDGMPKGKALGYVIFQCLGAFFGAAVTMCIFTVWPGQYELYGTGIYHTGASKGTPFGSAFLTEVVA